MLKRAIAGWNAVSCPKPRSDTDKDGRNLLVRVFPPMALDLAKNIGVQYCESAWEPTPAELVMLFAGGSIILRIGGPQVPVVLYVEPPRSADPVPA